MVTSFMATSHVSDVKFHPSNQEHEGEVCSDPYLLQVKTHRNRDRKAELREHIGWTLDVLLLPNVL